MPVYPGAQVIDSKVVAEVGVEPRMTAMNVQVTDSALPSMPNLPRMPPHIALDCPGSSLA
jgi:hypothetical protein